TGLSNYAGADNLVRSVPYARIATVVVSHYDVSTAGLGIEAGGQFYNISGQQTMTGTPNQDVTIIGNNSTPRAATFTAQTA
ncbi:hypothetical protein RSW31_26000, partial [Escherichia coli]|uniref:hypothetical protein n=1 Tax=Escherichia coli TaxID=562 RepID=UPI0028DEC04A